MGQLTPADGADVQSIEDALRRPARHWSADGLGEMVAGGLVLLWGAVIAAPQLWPSLGIGWLGAWLPMVSALALLVFYGRLTRFLQAIKARFVDPRIGYVKTKPPSRPRRLAAGIVAALVGALVVAVAARSGAMRSLYPLLTGVVYAGGAAAFSFRLGLPRLLAYALLSVGAGVLAQWGLSPDLGVAAVMCASGLSWLVGGAIVLRGILRQPIAEEPQQ